MLLGTIFVFDFPSNIWNFEWVLNSVLFRILRNTCSNVCLWCISLKMQPYWSERQSTQQKVGKGCMRKARTQSMCRSVNHFKYFEWRIKSRLLIIWILVKQSCAGWLRKVELKLQIRFWQSVTIWGLILEWVFEILSPKLSFVLKAVCQCTAGRT